MCNADRAVANLSETIVNERRISETLKKQNNLRDSNLLHVSKSTGSHAPRLHMNRLIRRASRPHVRVGICMTVCVHVRARVHGACVCERVQANVR